MSFFKGLEQQHAKDVEDVCDVTLEVLGNRFHIEAMPTSPSPNGAPILAPSISSVSHWQAAEAKPTCWTSARVLMALCLWLGNQLENASKHLERSIHKLGPEYSMQHLVQNLEHRIQNAGGALPAPHLTAA